MTHTVASHSRGTQRHPRVLTVNPPTLPTTRIHRPEGSTTKEALKDEQIMGHASFEDLKLLHIEVNFEEAKES